MHKRRILIVEDEIIAAEVTRNKLLQLGYEAPETIVSGHEAIQKAQAYQPDLVLMDIKLKGDMDGTRAAEEIRTKLDIPVIFITAYSDDATLQRARDSEPFGYLIKPFRAEELRTTIEMALYKHQLDVKLRASESRFRNFVQQSSEGFILIDERGIVIEWNRSAEKITGIPARAITGKPVWNSTFQYLPESHIAGVEEHGFQKQIIEALRTGELSKLEPITRVNLMTYTRPNGSEHYVQQRFFAIDAGSCYHLGGVLLDITERIQTEKRLHYLATHDTLTGLPNRSLYNDRARHAIASARRTSSTLAFMYLDLDGFKAVNDSHGHDKGDQLLRVVGDRLQFCLRETDTVARFGGDEFTICLENISHPMDAAIVAQKINAQLAAPFQVGKDKFQISASIGISIYPDDGVEVGELLSKADTAMYRVKAAGKNNYNFFSQQQLNSIP